MPKIFCLVVLMRGKMKNIDSYTYCTVYCIPNVEKIVTSELPVILIGIFCGLENPKNSAKSAEICCGFENSIKVRANPQKYVDLKT